MSFSIVQPVESVEDAVSSILTSIDRTKISMRCSELMPRSKVASEISALWESFSAVSALM